MIMTMVVCVYVCDERETREMDPDNELFNVFGVCIWCDGRSGEGYEVN